MPALYDFLQKNQIEKASVLPAVHSTEAYFIKKFIQTERIQVRPCRFFDNSELAYFFVGRPAFKQTLKGEPYFWELPMCAVVEYAAVKRKRVFPFDTGAFKTNRYPDYLSMMDLNDFDVAADPEAPEKLMGTFFGTNRSYFHLQARQKASFEARFDVEVLEEEVRALYALIDHKSGKVDDRRFAIELQTDVSFELISGNVIAFILPEPYIESEKVVDFVESKLGAFLLTYPVLPLKKEAYYYAIYEIIDRLYREGHYRV